MSPPYKAEIQKRYLLGEPIASIIRDYPGLSAKQVYNWIARESWKSKREQIEANLPAIVEADLAAASAKAMAFIHAVFDALIIDGELDTAALESIPSTVINTCLAKALPDGLHDSKHEPPKIVGILGYDPEQI